MYLLHQLGSVRLVTLCWVLSSRVWHHITGRELTNILEDLLLMFPSWFCWNSVHCTRVTDITSPNTESPDTLLWEPKIFLLCRVQFIRTSLVLLTLHVGHVMIKCNLSTGTAFWTSVKKRIQVLWDMIWCWMIITSFFLFIYFIQTNSCTLFKHIRIHIWNIKFLKMFVKHIIKTLHVSVTIVWPSSGAVFRA